MDLPKKRREMGVIQYSAMIAKMVLPAGANQKWPAKSGVWRDVAKYGSANRGIAFRMDGMCEGKMEDVMEAGCRLARELMKNGDLIGARAVFERVKRIPREYTNRQSAREYREIRKIG